MSDPLLPADDHQTALQDDDRDGLIPSYIATRADLNDAEQRNVLEALKRVPPSTETLLDDKYLRDLHKAMLGRVWKWAGQYRQRETNIGIDPAQIPIEMRTLVGDAHAWVRHEPDGPDEVAARFHHRLVQIHPFPNGNGRHGRISADYLLTSIGQPPFSWGRGLQLPTDELRLRYVDALRQADSGDIADLLIFCRSAQPI